MSGSAMPGPLSGRRVIEIGHMLAGPYCGMMLADLGAEVIKIETEFGDAARSIGSNAVCGHNVYFASLNRSKKSVVLDLASIEGRESLHTLVRTADVVICNLRPAAIIKLGLTYDALREINPGIVCVAITGFGLKGKYSHLAAYDFTIQAMVGVTRLTGGPSDPPTRVGYSVADNTGGLMATIGVLSKLVEGTGGQIDISLYDTMLSQMNYLASAWLNCGERPERQADGAHRYLVPAQFFRTADGDMVLFIAHDEQWAAFAQESGHPEWISDPLFNSIGARSANRDAVLRAVQEVLIADTTDNWIVRLQKIGIATSSVRDLVEALEDQHTRDSEMVVSVPVENGELLLVGNPIKLDGYAREYRAPPRLGQHNSELPG